MRKHTLIVPSSNEASDWFSFINENLQFINDFDLLEIDFNIVKFLDTDDFVVLACLIESFYSNGCKISFVGGALGFNSHLHNIKFKKYWEEGFDREAFTIGLNRSTLCLWKISENMIESYSMYAKKYFKNTFMNDRDLVPLASSLKEVFNNIFDHSKSSINGYIITQYYPRKNKLSFSVCDFGIGIPSAINDYQVATNKNRIEDWKAILKSLELGVSTMSSPRNRGMGLNNILEFTESSNGTLRIVSNNGVVTKEANGMYKMGEVDYNFKGTLIKVEVDTTTFEQFDEGDQIFDF